MGETDLSVTKQTHVARDGEPRLRFLTTHNINKLKAAGSLNAKCKFCAFSPRGLFVRWGSRHQDSRTIPKELRQSILFPSSSSLLGVEARSIFAAGTSSPSPIKVSLAVIDAVPGPVEVCLVVPVGPPGHRQARVVVRTPRVQRGAEARYLSQKAEDCLS